jgi:hypothetical protein
VSVRRAALVTVFAVPAAICALWTVRAGKDVNWDLLNYHYYLPFELVAGRLGQDFFAASSQSYLNPVGYLPFYAMLAAGWHSVVASIALALAHSAGIALLYLVSWRLFAHRAHRERTVLSILATALGTATAVFWTTVGGSFLDPLLVVPMLAGLLLLLADGGPARRASLAGALFGAAAALKYSNAIYALAALPLALAVPRAGVSERLRAGAGYLAGAAAAFAVLAGPWLARMALEFGNPVFPLMNAWFRSPHAPAVNLASERFALHDPIAALALPFRMATLDRSLYAEAFAPDVRPAALLAAALALAVLAAARRASPAGALRGTDGRVLAFFGLASALWLASSANARYGLIVLLLAGVCLARLVERLLPAGAARVALGALLAVQLGMTMLASPSRWFIAEPWSRRWLPYDVPERASREPALYLSVEMLPMAAIAPLVHPGSSFVNFRGQHSLPPDSPRLAALLERHRGRVRTLGRALELAGGTPPADQVSAYDATLARIGYRVDVGDCFAIPWRPDDDDLLSRAANRVMGTPPSREPLSVTSCALRPAPRDPALAERERRVSALFDRMERRCPRVFRGQTAVTEPLGEGWSRNYTGLDARLEAYGDRVVLNRYRAGTGIDLGALSEWERDGGILPAACRGPERPAR